MIHIVDYGMGNLGSMRNMFKRISAGVNIESDPKKLALATKLVLPGVGSFDAAMTRINTTDGLREVLEHKANVEKIPILGVCLGMQLLTSSSEEGNLSGLDWIKAKALRFPDKSGLKIPHMGWNSIKILNKNSKIKPLENDYYFVHSYYFDCTNSNNILAETKYGINFPSIVNKENVYGCQFHPEKSSNQGLNIIKDFINL